MAAEEQNAQPPVEQDVEASGQQAGAAWPDHKLQRPGNSVPERLRNYCGGCKFSWYVETRNGRQHLKDVVLDPNNWRAGVTVALVSLPLSISLGIASGASPTRGLATAIFGGLCAGIFGSSDYNILGPAGALSAMLMSYSVQWGEDVIPWLSLFSAGICLVAALLRLDTYMLLLPKSVLEGFTMGVGLIIGLNQINFACGLVPATKHAHFVMNIYESLKIIGDLKVSSLVIFLLSTPVLFALMKKYPKIPWICILPAVTIPLGWLCDAGHLDLEVLTLKSKYGVLQPEIVQPLRATSASFADMVVPSFSIAAVAILETLISAKIAGIMVDRDFSVQGEMRGLVVAHAVCGAVGAMPPTGVFVRTSLNASLGATFRFAQVLNAALVCIITLAAMPVFSYLPQASIAAILVVCSIRMMPLDYVKLVWKEDKWALFLCTVVAVVCVAEDPVIGLAAGMVMALLGRAKSTQLAKFVEIYSQPEGAYRIVVHGVLTYVNSDSFVERVRHLSTPPSNIELNLYGVVQLDHDGVEALEKVIKSWQSSSEAGCTVFLKGVRPALHWSLEHVEWFKKAEEEGRIELA